MTFARAFAGLVAAVLTGAAMGVIAAPVVCEQPPSLPDMTVCRDTCETGPTVNRSDGEVHIVMDDGSVFVIMPDRAECVYLIPADTDMGYCVGEAG